MALRYFHRCIWFRQGSVTLELLRDRIIEAHPDVRLEMVEIFSYERSIMPCSLQVAELIEVVRNFSTGASEGITIICYSQGIEFLSLFSFSRSPSDRSAERPSSCLWGPQEPSCCFWSPPSYLRGHPGYLWGLPGYLWGLPRSFQSFP